MIYVASFSFLGLKLKVWTTLKLVLRTRAWLSSQAYAIAFFGPPIIFTF
jgi:hypothetical protein